MKSTRIFFVTAALGCMLNVSAQKMFAADKYNAACSYYGETITGDVKAYDPDTTTDKVVKNILAVIGLRPNFELRAANVPNAAAVILDSKRYILYNPKFMSEINAASGSDWAGISILAHEIGHHLNGHTLDKVGSRPETELEADEFSGFVLRRMGASLTDAQSAMALIASLKGSHSHPPKKDRLTSIAAGYNNASGGASDNDIASNQTDTHITKPAVVTRPQIMKRPDTQKGVNKSVAARKTRSQNTTVKAVPAKKSTTMLADKYIACDVYFSADPKGKYYITTKGHLVQADNNNIYMIGRLAQSNKPGYTSMLSDKQYNYMYIGAGGVVVNGAGEKVGQLAMR